MSVAIIGAGLAGLACAYKLKRRGIDAVVFEASDRIGGRAVAAPFLLGPEVFKNTFNLIDELGLGSELLAVRRVVGQLYRGKVYHHQVASASGLLHFKGLNVLDKAMLPKMAFFLSRHATSLDFHHPAKGLIHDTENVAEFVRREFSRNILNYLVGPMVSSLFFYGSEETSKLLYLLLAKYMHSTDLYTLRSGFAPLVQRLSEGVRLRTASQPEIIRNENSFVIDNEEFASVVIATPGDAVLSIRGMSRILNDEDHRFFESCQYQRALTIFVETGRPVDGRCYAVSIPRVEKMAANTITFHDFIDPSNVPAGRGLLSITGGGRHVTEAELLRDLTQIYPMNDSEARAVDWSPAMPKFPPGRFKSIDEFRSRTRMPGLFFCGDYLMGPFVEAAVSTGLQAAESIPKPG